MASRRTRPAVVAPSPALSKPASAPTWLRGVVWALAAIALIAWFSSASSDSDTWWTLRIGQYIAQHHQLPVPDPFSFTTYLGNAGPAQAAMRDYNLKFEWLAELVLYWIYAATGFTGIVLLRALALAFFSAASGVVVYHRT